MTIALTVAFALILITAYAKRIQEVPATVGVTAVRKLHEAELEAVGQIVARGIDSAPQVLEVFENRDCGLYPALEDGDVIDITDEIEIIPSLQANEADAIRIIDALLLGIKIRQFEERNLEEVMREVVQAGKAEMALLEAR